MTAENVFLVHALLMGIYITFIYDILRIVRRVFPHSGFMVSLEDILFWIYCAVIVFLLMYHESNGTLRWFAVFGAIAGMILYKRLVSPYFVKYVSLVLQKIFDILTKILRLILRPFVKSGRKLKEKMARAARRRAVKLQKKREQRRRFFKKKLTLLQKVLKIKL